MNKSELIKKLSSEIESSQKEAEKILSSFIKIIKESLEKNEKILITGFGSFEVRHKKERKGKHPRTGMPITIPAQKVPHFKMNKNLKDMFKKK